MAINAVRYYFGLIETDIMPVKQKFLFLSIALIFTAITLRAQITPATALLGPSQQQQFTLVTQFQQQTSTQPGPALSASWMVVPSSSGTISANGLFTAAASIPVATTARVYAQSGSILYEAKVQLNPESVSSTGPTDPSSFPVSISVSPTFAYLYAGQTQQFMASISGSANQQALWSITQGPGTISGGLYTAPLSVAIDKLVTISATSVADPTKSVSATILVGPAATAPTAPTGGSSPPLNPTTTSVTPAKASVAPSGTQQFSVTNVPFDTSVAWSLSPQVGSISASGLYTAPNSVAVAETITVTALNASTLTSLGSAALNLQASPATSVSPATTTVAPSGTQQFSVVNLPGGASVTWSLNPAVGSISASGVFTAPSSVSAAQVLTVTAKNSSTLAVLGTASLTLDASTSVSPATVTLAPSGTKQFSILNLPSGVGVAWSVSSTTSGSISTSGLYTALSYVAAQQTVTVTAKNNYTFAVLGTASLTVDASPTPSVSPAAATVAPSGVQHYSVQNMPSGVTPAWYISPALGSISTAGVYTAPGNVASQTTVTVTARNNYTFAMLGTASLTVDASPTSSVSPATATVAPSGTKQFSVVNLPSGDTVTWSVSPATGGISSAGLYTAPSSVASQTTITVTAKNGSTVLGTASVTLQASATSTVSPATATVAPAGVQHYSVQNMPSGVTAAWYISPALGSISTAGVYTAPGNVASQTTVTVTARNNYTFAMLGTASLTVDASPTSSVSPATATVAPSGTKQFSVLNLPSGDTITWSISPATGSISSAGVYTAPSNVASQTTVTVTAKNASTVLGTASVTLQASPTPSVSPATATVAPSGTKQFSVVNLPSGDTVTWSVSPATGSISTAGLYTAPTSVASQTTITVTAKNGSTVLGTASVTLQASPAPSVSPATATVAPSGTKQFSVVNLPSGDTVTWSVSPAMGSISTSGMYTAPTSVASQTTVTVTAKNSSTVLATASMTLQASVSSTITLPIEVIGANGTTAAVSFTVPSVSSQMQLAMQIHGLSYQTEASVKVNNSAWIPINSSTVTLLGLASNFGGIGGGFRTLQMTMNLPAGEIVAGTNTVTFRFNGTDGNVSGYRVLAVNVQPVGGAGLIPASTFVWDDPNTWQPPSSAASDIAAGTSLWNTAPLTVPSASGAISAIKAHCADCHSQDARDLKYFNYSNNSIVARSTFHGLTAAQGNQIASYVRSLNVPNPGRPWNPPYQPGPGMDSQPVTSWAAGAGLDAVLASDAAMQPYLAPGGSTATWAAHSYLNPRELPIPLQMPDWNAWLPQVHPIDSFGATFTNSQVNTRYLTLRGELQPNSTTAYANALNDFNIWFQQYSMFMQPLEEAGESTSHPTWMFSLAQWKMVKQWELSQEFGLEGMPAVVYGAKADARSWYGNQAFLTSPRQQHIPQGPGFSNGTAAGYEYQGYVWYHMQLVLNDGEGQQKDNNPIDYGYAEAAPKDLSYSSGYIPTAMLEVMWMIKSLQENTLKGVGPNASSIDGFTPTAPTPGNLLAFPIEWSATSATTRTTLTQAYVEAWFPEISSFTPAQFYAGKDGNGRPWASATENPATEYIDYYFGGQIWYTLPRLRYIGVDANLTYQISAWAATVWPAGNWALNNAATCNAAGHCTSDPPQ